MLLFKLRGTEGRVTAFHEVPLRPCFSFRIGDRRLLAGFGVQQLASIFSGLENHSVFDRNWLVVKKENEVSGGENHLAVLTLGALPTHGGTQRVLCEERTRVYLTLQCTSSIPVLRKSVGEGHRQGLARGTPHTVSSWVARCLLTLV